MRVHRLEISAFGPFAGTEVIDFEELNESGFFLLTGPTGAGKTSVLDAICFGLYGAVPGVRNSAKDLKSHHAPPRQQPVVELEVTLRDRRFRFRRTPAWRRPSTRAKAGYVDENASVQAAELVDGDWVSRGTRLDEVGLLVSRVLGMSKEQFCQVVMLPQGQFETFLRAGAKERHDVLEALFHTGRFQQIEKWLSEHRRRCDQESRIHEDQIQLLLARIEEANGARWYDEQLSPHDAAAALSEHVVGLALTVDHFREQLDVATAAAKEREHAASEAELLSRRRADFAEAQRQLHELDALRETVRRREQQIAHARLADKLTPQLALLDEAAEQRDALATAADEARAHAIASGAVPKPDSTPAQADERAVEIRDRIAELMAAREIEVAASKTRRDLTDVEESLASATSALAAAEAALAAIPQVLADARQELEQATREASRYEALQLRHRDAAKVHAAAAQLPLAESELTSARAAERLAHEQHLSARDTLADIREARISSMSAHLASELSAGAECPVCGSVDHPRPARIDSRHVTESDEARAAGVAQQAADSHTAARAKVVQHERLVSELADAAAGIDEPSAATAVVVAANSVEAARAAAAAASDLAAQISELEQHHLAAQATVAERLRSKDALEVTRDHQRALLADLDLRRDAVLPHGGTAQSELGTARMQMADLDMWRSATSELVKAEKAWAKQRTGFDRQLHSSDFSDVDTLRSAIMTAPEISAAEALNRTYAERRAITLHRLDDPHLQAASQADAPDLTSLNTAAVTAQTAHREAAERYRAASQRHERLIRLEEDLHDSLTRWEPLRSARDLAAGVAAMCAGTSADNQTRTRLSHYVLASRLQQVVDAANVRLLSISSGRYQLLHTMLKGVGDTRGGLGLRVLDTYTGQERDPATLSGGETFYVSLALALGLADLVRDEIGGSELSTLFVDEGFGSLDADTLDEVLDEIDSLRSGGRSVGLVSHLSELRRRIPTQVRIVPSQHGSKVSPI